MRLERADAVRELLGQHGHGAVREIDGGAAQARFAIERRIARDVMRHVGDVHLQMPAARAALDVNGVVEIARGFAVDGDDGQMRGNRGGRRAPRRPPAAPRAAPLPAPLRESGAAGDACESGFRRPRRIRRGGRALRSTRPAGATPPRGKRVSSTLHHGAVEFRSRCGRAAGRDAARAEFGAQLRRQLLAGRNHDLLRECAFRKAARRCRAGRSGKGRRPSGGRGRARARCDLRRGRRAAARCPAVAARSMRATTRSPCMASPS